MGLMRNIPDAHPVYKLLRPHMRYTTAINTMARESLLGPKGAIAATFSIGSEGQNVVLQRAGKKYSVHWSNIKRHTRHRGVDDAAKLPHYNYRDDGFKIWDAIEAYVSSIIHMFYADDTAVKDDQELQNFAKDLHLNGFPAYGGSSTGHDFPPCIVSRAELFAPSSCSLDQPNMLQSTLASTPTTALFPIPHSPSMSLRLLKRANSPTKN